MTKHIIAAIGGIINSVFFYFLFVFLIFNFGGMPGYCYYYSIKQPDGSEVCQPIGKVIPDGLAHNIVLLLIAAVCGIIGYKIYEKIMKEWHKQS